MLKIEILYSEVANLFGDLFNIHYLKESFPDTEIVYTSLKDTPAFVNREDLDLVYLGPMPEDAQEWVIDALRPHTDVLRQRIDAGRPFLFTGNAWEVLGQYIERDDGSRIEALGIHPGYAVRRMMSRYNSLYLGKMPLQATGDAGSANSQSNQNAAEAMDIIGFKSQFSATYGIPQELALFQTVRECDAEHSAGTEGMRMQNCFGTYLLGPFLIVDPGFTRYLLRVMGVQEPLLAFEKEVDYAYEERMRDFLDPTKDFH